jgi:hypothetical protein
MPSSVGMIKEDYGSGEGYVVDFPEQSDWSCADGELELVGDASVSPAGSCAFKEPLGNRPGLSNCDG